MDTNLDNTLPYWSPDAVDFRFADIEATLLNDQQAGIAPAYYAGQLPLVVENDITLWWNLTEEAWCVLHGLNRTNWTRPEGEGKLFSRRDLTAQLAMLKANIRGGRKIGEHRKLTDEEWFAIKRLDDTLMHYHGIM